MVGTFSLVSRMVGMALLPGGYVSSHPFGGSTSFLEGSAKTLLQEQLRPNPFSGREDA